MTATTTTPATTRGPRGSSVLGRRLLGLVLAVAAAAVGWTVVTQLIGLELVQPDLGQGSFPVRLPAVLFASLVAGALGLGLLSLLDRFTSRSALVWSGVAAAVFLVSLAGPLGGAGVTTGNRVGLISLHVLVAVVLIPLVGRTGRRS
jgi:hypothetical protein